MNPTRTALIGLLAFTLAPQAQGQVQKQGRYWVETVEGTVQAGTRLRISSVGAVSVEGQPGQEVRYTVIKKVRAGNQQEAERRLAQAQVTAALQNVTAAISAISPGCRRCGFSADMRVIVPTSTHQALVSTAGGSLRVLDLQGRVNADSEGGSIEIRRVGRSVRASTAGGSITLDSIGGDVSCETAGGDISLKDARADATLTTNGGGIAVEGVLGTLRAETSGGNISVRSVGGNLVAATSGGSIRLQQVAGMVRAETAGGSIHVTSAPAGLTVEATGGEIRLTDVAGAVVAANAAGNIRAYFLAGHPLRNSLLETNVGNIEVWLPLDLKVTVMAIVELAGDSRRIQSDFNAIRVKNESDEFGLGSVVAEGSINGGGPVLRISNTTGRIKIHRLH